MSLNIDFLANQNEEDEMARDELDKENSEILGSQSKKALGS